MVGNIMRFICKINHSIGSGRWLRYLVQKGMQVKRFHFIQIVLIRSFILALVQPEEPHSIIKKDIPFLFKREIVCAFNNSNGRFQ